MKDRKLEEQISTVEKFIEGWKRLGEVLSSREKISDEELLRMKEELSTLHGLLMVSLGIEEKRGMDFLEGLGRSLQGGELRRFHDSWYSCLVFMDEVLGRLRERRSEMASVGGFQVFMRDLFSNPFIRLAVLFLCILFLYYIIKTFVIREKAPPEEPRIRIERTL